MRSNIMSFLTMEYWNIGNIVEFDKSNISSEQRVYYTVHSLGSIQTN